MSAVAARIPAADSGTALNSPRDLPAPAPVPMQPPGTNGADAQLFPAAMREAAAKLREGDLAGAIRGQRDVLEALDQMLSAPKTPSDPGQSPRGAEAGASPQPGGPSTGTGPNREGAAAESTPGDRDSRPVAVDLERRRNLATSVWGHLPDREREQMLQSFRENYLPGYEDHVEAYYEALAGQRLTTDPIAPPPLLDAP
jgi:hypothetical protein